MRPRALHVLFALLAVGFFAAPVAARILGVTAEEFENRRFADAPRLSQGWDAFQQTTRFLTDRMPLRAQAIRANTRIWTGVFGTDPDYTGGETLAGDQALPFAGAIEGGAIDGGRPSTYSGVRSGSEGWVYLDSEFEYACDRTTSPEEVVERWGAVVRAVRARGLTSFMFAVPSKSSVYPEHLPAKYPFDHCALRRIDEFWDVMARAGARHGVLEVRGELLRLKRYAGDGVFQRKDYHWTTLGAISLVKIALEAIDRGVRLDSREIVKRGQVTYTGDLSALGGRSETDVRDEYDIVRPPDAPRVPGRTLLVCDSFAYKWLRIFRPYFESLRHVTIYSPTQEIAPAIRRSDTVLFIANELFVKGQAAPEKKADDIVAELNANRR